MVIAVTNACFHLPVTSDEWSAVQATEFTRAYSWDSSGGERWKDDTDHVIRQALTEMGARVGGLHRDGGTGVTS